MLMKRLYSFMLSMAIAICASAQFKSSVWMVPNDMYMGPQISFRLDDLKEMTGLPGAAISSFDYALCNCEAIYKQAKALVDGK